MNKLTQLLLVVLDSYFSCKIIQIDNNFHNFTCELISVFKFLIKV